MQDHTTLTRREGFGVGAYLLLGAALLGVLGGCVSLGSVPVRLADVARVIFGGSGATGVPAATRAIIASVRLPRVLCAAICGAALSLCGAAMQGLLKNPLADGSTLGVSSGASLGAAIAITFGISIPGIPFGGTVVLACAFAFLSIVVILALAYRLDHALSTNTIILMGVIFSMFASSLTSLVVMFAGERVKNILFWTMGSLAGVTYGDALLMLCALALFGGVLLVSARELNAFAVGEENARHVGVDVRRVRLLVLVCVSVLTGVCVSVCGVIGFVGLVIPHMMRLCFGPNHKKLLPATLFGGAAFLLLADLAARTALAPREMPIGIITSAVGAAAFLVIFFRTRRLA